jgi:predicted metal-dependent hydrolase
MEKYILKVSKRARRIRITISRDKGLVVTVPSRMRESMRERSIEKFLAEKADWIRKNQARIESLGPPLLPPAKRGDYKKYKQQALALAEARVAYWNQRYGFVVNSIGVKNQKTRWGSCSRKGNLNFNYKIALLPQTLADYIIVHEICHLKEMNHSPKFWSLVERTFPNHKQLRKQLRTNSLR